MQLKVDVVFIPALLCDEQLYRKVIDVSSTQISPAVMMSSKPTLADSCTDILARAPSRFVLVGTSYGGNLAIEIALAAPKRVLGLWLMGCDPGTPRQDWPDIARALEVMPDGVIDMLAGLVVCATDTASVSAFRQMAARVGNTAGAAQARALASRDNQAARLGELSMPTLLTWGAEDSLVPPTVGEAMAKRIVNAVLHVLDGCGHLPTLEKPDQTAALLSGLIERVLAASATSRYL